MTKILLTKEDVKIILDRCANDGHTILKPKALDGVNPEFVKRVTTTFMSDFTDPKWTIFGHDGRMIPKTEGIYTLSVLALACDGLNLENDAGEYNGRGRQASAYTAALRKWLDSQ